MKSRVYLDPMSPDGKPGEVREISYNEGAPQFLAPVSYAENDSTEGKLRNDVRTAAAKLQHAKARGVGVAQAQRAHEDAKSAAGKAHADRQRERMQQKTGIDYGAPEPFSRDTRQFMEVRDYSEERDDGAESPSEEQAEEELKAAIRKAVDALEQAVSAGAPQAEVLKLAAAIKVLRDQLDNPSAPPADTSSAPPRKSHIDQNPGGEKDTTAIEAPFPRAQPISSGPGSRQAAAPAAAPAVPLAPGGKKQTEAQWRAAWKKQLDDLDKRLAKRALEHVYAPGEITTAPAKATHAARNAAEERAARARRIWARVGELLA